MTRPGKMAVILALFVALIGSPAGADDSDTFRKTEDRVRDLEASVKQLRETLRQRDLDARFTDAELKALTARLERIERSLEVLQGSTARRAFSIDPNPRTGTSTIRLRNDMAVTARVTIDGESFTIRPFATRVLRNQPTGRISYYIDADGLRPGPLVRSRVNPSETLTIRVYDPRDVEE